ncbi:GntR family transcriptional regulator [Cohnella sp. REN36]|uniref:GntR family transcriptional regulator n=1 Tax=Cohnella sp. REN36 TaxID=2887347 RepID=UPI001D1498B0|nr:GntR family transcriptional regulator [Cohnella sp. REN36]MCC3377117.1 GntR family transcriptional regulator [Cohnella sp. REN36]
MNIILSNATDEPIYAQIARQIREQIWSGSLASGAPLPSIRQLAKDLRISVITTKRAYEELEKEGLIDSVVGKGSFVAGVSPALLRERRLRRLEELLEEAARESRALGMGLDELVGLLAILYENGGSEHE